MKREAISVADRIANTISRANVRLAEITHAGFPFSLEEVVMTVQEDKAGVYLHSGETPICSVPRRGDPAFALEEMERVIRETVEDVKAAVDRRSSLLAEERALKDEDERLTKAQDALKSVGLDPSSMGLGVNADVKAAIVEAAEKAVKKANQFRFIGIVSYHEYRMSVSGHGGGIVIKAGGKPVMITRFPHGCCANNKAIERTIAFIQADIAALADSRRRYFEAVRLEADREARLREIGESMEDAERRLLAVGM